MNSTQKHTVQTINDLLVQNGVDALIKVTTGKWRASCTNSAAKKQTYLSGQWVASHRRSRGTVEALRNAVVASGFSVVDTWADDYNVGVVFN